MNILRKILHGAAKYWYILAICCFSILSITALNLISPWLIRELINILSNTLDDDAMRRIINIGIIVSITYILRVVFRFLQNYLAHWVAWHYVHEIRVRMYSHLQSLSLSYYHDKQTGQLMSRVINDTATFEALIAHSIPDTLTNIFVFIGVVAFMCAINPLLTLLTCIPIPFIVIGGYIFSKKVRPNFRAAQRDMGELNAALQDNLSGVREIQVFNQQEREHKVISNRSKSWMKSILKALKLSGIFHPTIEFLTSVGTVIVIICGGMLALQGSVNTADIVAFLLYLAMFYAPVITFSRVTEEFQNSMAGAERVFEVLDTMPDIKDEPHAKPLKHCKGNIRFDHVDFSYRNDVPVLRDVNFNVPAGHMLAIVGPTGVGKTTIINLLSRFYDTNGGTVSIDGIPIKDIKLASLRDNISIVLQDVFLFNGTVAENISYANENATMDEIIEAAKAAHIHEEIMRMPEGYETLIGERGLKLSGGQKQRLSIARAILHDSPILILDEATAAVDTGTEVRIQRAINALAGSRTLVVIAHRLSTIRRANHIIVLEDTGIAEQGSHEQLMAMNGLYAKLIRAQEADLKAVNE